MRFEFIARYRGIWQTRHMCQSRWHQSTHAELGTLSLATVRRRYL
jgi:hypothetical protein